MKRMILIGETGSGKTSMLRVLRGLPFSSRKTQAVEYAGGMMDTPGEYLENRRYYHALVTTSTDADVVCFVQDSTRKASIFPPKFATMFSKKVIGLVTKIDVAEGDPERAEGFLRSAGAETIIRASSKENLGLGDLRQYLEEE